ncbi:hypothetical protein HU200_010400 [Digitaria exilis]|uniref:Uncharacterized protein n=1 Tax=Digitaria exilis TaxID=1010633 RepID=A0A835FII6_9POAL|nr:hypothetical protein HU200_010400 [Digitaria exilis]
MMMTAGESKSPARALRRLAGAAVAAVLLRRSFSASKCKTEARMAAARMKLLRNRREAQVRQMRRDIAALLRDKQEDTARIRVSTRHHKFQFVLCALRNLFFRETFGCGESLEPRLRLFFVSDLSVYMRVFGIPGQRYQEIPYKLLLMIWFLLVEHVIREQNFMAANEIIELFCELIVTRLPIIAKQKFVLKRFLTSKILYSQTKEKKFLICATTLSILLFRECPADLKEGICSLIFAAPRCSELPELGRIRDIFEKKYGKDFVSAAVDLRPDAAVNTLLIEKLSVKKPSGQTKLKVLKDIAKEHQIDWDTTESEQELLRPSEELIVWPSTFVEASNMPVKTTLTPHVVQPIPTNFSPGYSDDEYDNGDTMQFRDAASAARAAAESAERAAYAAKAAADLANKNNHSLDGVEGFQDSSHESTHHPRKRQSMSNSSRSSRKEDTDAFEELKPHGGKASSAGSFSGTTHREDRDNYPAELDARKTRPRNSRATRKVHSDIKFDDSEGLCSESEDENDVEIQSVERPLPPRREPFSENRHPEEEEPDNDFPELPKANIHSRVHPNMPLDYETLTARFEALKSGKLP